MNLAQAIAAAHDNNERALAARNAAPMECDEQLLARFTEFCKGHGVRALLAAPGTVAAWIITNEINSPETILRTLQAVEAAHSNHNLANPVACPSPQAALARVLKVEAPMSWSKTDKLKFMTLPADIQEIISRRARQDEVALRRAQSELAEIRNQLKEQKGTNENVEVSSQ
jgi:hypothetical protein